jgi:flagellar biosynthesis GTPase FlhF
VSGRSDPTGDAALVAALSELYAVAPDGFVGTRTALVQAAKARGDASLATEVGRLRRPTVAAWAVNQVVRQRPALVARLHDVGGRLRAAQAELDASAMRDLRSDRDGLLAQWSEAAAEVAGGAGRPLAPAALDEVRGTVIAALASAEATEAAVSGHLTRALSYSGFGEVDLSEAVVRTSSGAVLTVVDAVADTVVDTVEPGPASDERSSTAATSKATTAKSATSRTGTAKARTSKVTTSKDTTEHRRTERKEAERRRAEAEAEQEQAERQEAERQEQARRMAGAEQARATAAAAAEEATLAVAGARDRVDEARWRVEELEEQLRKARQEHRDAEQAATVAARARRAAQVALATAERALRTAGADSRS